MDTPTQRRTAAATTGVTKPAGVPASVFDVAKPDKKARAPRINSVDLTNVTIRTGVPLPPASIGPNSGSPYKTLLAKMKPGNMVELDERLARGLQSHARKSGVKTAVRALGDGRFGVWRL